MQIKRTKNGIIVIGAQYLLDGTMIPNNYSAAMDTTSGLPPEMKQEAQNILTSFKKGIVTGDSDIPGLELVYPAADSFLEKPGFDDTFNAPESMKANFNKFTVPESMKANFGIFTIPESMEAARNQNPNKCRKISKTLPKRIHNPITGKYYQLRQRTTKNGIAGKIKGLWSSKKVTK